MKKLFLWVLLAGSVSNVKAQYFAIPDSNFVAVLQQYVPNAMFGNSLDTNHVDVLSLYSLTITNAGISDLTGIQFFDSLKWLSVSNTQLTTLPRLPRSLILLDCPNNQLTSLPPLPNSLTNFSCSSNQLTSLPPLPGSLLALYCQTNQLTSLPPMPSSIEMFNCTYNQLTTLPSLPGGIEELFCYNNQLDSLPALPSSLKRLLCYNNQLTTLPSLPGGIEELFCYNNQLDSLPALPSSLKRLLCYNNQLSGLPVLPSSIEYVYCENNQLTSLPSLPSSLLSFRGHNNQLTSLPPLPSSLLQLHCQYNQITTLPILPSSLILLACGDNQLTGLPSLPSSLKTLMCSRNQISTLPDLPNTIEHIWCRDNQLICLPVLPEGLMNLRCYGNAISCLPNIPISLVPNITGTAMVNLGFSPVLCSPSTPCFPSESIVGIVFNDENGNGYQDPQEQPFVNAIAYGQPGNLMSGVANDGRYGLSVDAGVYTVQGQSIPYHIITTLAHNVTISPGQKDSLNDIGYQAIPGIYDLGVEINADATRSGFDNNIYLQVRNKGTEISTANIDFDFEPNQTWISASIAPNLLSGNTANWTFTMNPGDIWNVTVTLNTDATVSLGDSVNHWFAAQTVFADTTPSDNSAHWNDVVVGSFIPNKKTVLPMSISPIQLLNDEAIEYTICFQNTGNNMVENVRISDTLSSDLEWGSFEYVSSSHDNYWYLSNGIIVFQFDSIQLPDSTANEANSHGFVKFRMKPSQTLQEGEQVLNAADIYFDFGDQQITSPSVFQIEIINDLNQYDKNRILVFPNPSKGAINVQSNSELYSIVIYQIDGQIVQLESASGNTHQLETALKQGIYLVEIETQNGTVTSRIMLE